MSHDVKDYNALLAAIRPSSCSWNDMGKHCPHAGLISFSTTGGGPWYCRQHADTFRGVPAMSIGNTVTARPISQASVERNKVWRMNSEKRYERVQGDA